MKNKLLVLFALMFLCNFAYAQERTITGKVTSGEGNSSLPGVSVFIKGTTTGTITNIDGEYSLSVPNAEDTLVFSFLGYESQELAVGSQTIIDVVLQVSAEALQEVMVTALGVERDARTLGYSVQQVESKVLDDAVTTNVVDALSGKAAGIQVTRSSGSAGGGSRILVRGITSLRGNNQPLIVIDGVRMNNDANYTEGTAGFGASAGTGTANRLSDINSDDIESINVLKGAAATALYGTAGATGVIIITTKKGHPHRGKKFSISYSTRGRYRCCFYLT